MKKVFVCSPYRGNIDANVRLACNISRKVVLEGHSPFTPHLFHTRFMDDRIESERNASIAGSNEFLKLCDEVWAWEPGMETSKGMQAEIKLAQSLGIAVRWINEADLQRLDTRYIIKTTERTNNGN